MFVSFIDPENYPHAEVTALYLSRAGMQPYLAKRDMRTGCDYWQDKIFPAIDRSAGLLVIWTEETLRRPELVVREIQRAQSSGVPVGLFLARGYSHPTNARKRSWNMHRSTQTILEKRSQTRSQPVRRRGRRPDGFSISKLFRIPVCAVTVHRPRPGLLR